MKARIRGGTLRFGSLSRTALMVTLLVMAARANGGPSDAAEVLAALSKLPANRAVLLGAPHIAGEFNATARAHQLDRTGPTGRDYSVKVVWAEDRQRALFAGANHQVPHRLNDVWEFDLPTLTWTMLYAPDNDRSYAGLGKDPGDVEFKDGLLVTRRGGPAIIGHTWWGITYDVPRKRLLFMNTWVSDQDKLVTQLGGDPAQRYKGPPLWSFDPAGRRWGFEKTDRPRPKAPFAGLLEYVPSLDGVVWHTNDWEQRATWLYTPATRRWLDLNPNPVDFIRESAGLEQVGYVDPVRNLIVAQCERRTHHYDVARSRWSRVINLPEDSQEVPFGHDARSGFYYDPVSGHGLFIELRTASIWSYDPDARRWTRLQPEGDALPPGSRRLAYVDPARNVLVVLQTDAVWAYRYRAR